MPLDRSRSVPLQELKTASERTSKEVSIRSQPSRLQVKAEITPLEVAICDGVTLDPCREMISNFSKLDFDWNQDSKVWLSDIPYEIMDLAQTALLHEKRFPRIRTPLDVFESELSDTSEPDEDLHMIASYMDAMLASDVSDGEKSPTSETPELLEASSDRSKQALVDRLVEGFLKTLDLEMTSNTYASSTSPEYSSTTTYSSSETSSRTSIAGATDSAGTIILNTAGGDNGDGDNSDLPRGQKALPFADQGAGHLQLACPFYKWKPEKYNALSRDWESCALHPHETIARVKQHLYRSHYVPQCLRCKTIFETETELNIHSSNDSESICEIQLAPLAEGITSDVMKELRRRKKRARGESKEERWRDIYKLLFPGENVPSPYLELTSEIPPPLPPEAGELVAYEEYVRRELPRVFRSTLEAAVNAQLQPLEERLRAQLAVMIQESQDRVFSQYRSRTYSLLAQPAAGPEPVRAVDNDFPYGPTAPYFAPCLEISKQSGFGTPTIEELPLNDHIPNSSDSTYASMSPLFLLEDIDETGDISTITSFNEPGWIEEPHEELQDFIYPRYNDSIGHFDIQTQPVSLTAEQAGIVDRVTNDMWRKFKNQLLPIVHGHGNSSNKGSQVVSSSKSQTSRSSKSSNSRTNCGGGKRKRIGAPEGDEEEEGREKRTMVATKDKEDLDKSLQFACPYRKWRPAKYTIQDWGPCAMTPRSTIARIKTHLYDYHQIHQCLRCNGIHETEDQLNIHINAEQGCPSIESQPGGKDGINRSLKDLISSRKRLFPGQTEEQKWEHIYELLFPDEPIPSPYWENPELQDRAYIENYHAYLIREVPSAFRSLVQEAVINDSNLIEENIRDRATSLIPAALNIVYHTYRATLDPNPSREDIPTISLEMTATSTITAAVLEKSPEPETVANAAFSRGLLQTQTSPMRHTRLDGLPSSSDSAYLSGNSNSGSSAPQDSWMEKNTDTTLGRTGIDSQTPESSHNMTSDRKPELDPHLSTQNGGAPESHLGATEAPQNKSLHEMQTEDSMFASGNPPIGNQMQLDDKFGNLDVTFPDLCPIDWDDWTANDGST